MVVADLPSRRIAPAPVMVAPMFTWTGFYVGLNAGYTWSTSNNVSVAATPIFLNPVAVGAPQGAAAAAADTSGVGPVKSHGFVFGGQAGYNYQMGSLVAGVETDIQGVFGSGSRQAFGGVTGVAGFAPITDVTMVGVQKRLDWFGTLRARLGVTVAPTFLLYPTGGLAYGGVRLNTLVNQQVTNSLVPPSFASASNSSTRVGWTIGVGGEYAFSQNWSAKVEYLYYDLGRAAQNFAHTAFAISGQPFFTNAVVTRTKFSGHIVRAGLNYRFNFGGAGPIVAKY